MRIGINLLYLLPGKVGGTETYARGLIDGLTDSDSQNEYVIFLNRESEGLELPSVPNLTRINCSVRGTFRGGRYAWEQVILPKKAQEYRLDVLHSLGYVCPLRTPCVNIVSILDMNYVALRDTMAWPRRAALRFFVQQSARYADHVLTISHFARNEIVRHTRISSEKITVTYLGCGLSERKPIGVTWDELSTRYGVKRPYILSFGSVSPHKNMDRLIRCFLEMSRRFPHNLILVGHLPKEAGTKELINNLGLHSRVFLTGHIPEADVMALLTSADLFVFPSLYEGFGLPILEAQHAGIPVACSTAAAIPEVAGKGARFFDPLSVSDMARVVQLCLSDQEMRRSLVSLGRENAHRFSWKQTASDTLGVYRRIFRRSCLREGESDALVR